MCKWVCLGNVHFYNTRYLIAPHGFLCLPRAHPRQCVVPEWTQAAGGRQKPPLRPLAAPHKRRGPHGRSAADVMCVPRVAFLETRCNISALLYPKCNILVPINRSHGVHQAMNQVQFNFMKVEPSHDGPDYSRLTEPEPSPSSGRAVPTRTHLCWPPGPK